MNAISLTMAKGTARHTLQGHALRLTALLVVLSWMAFQLLVDSGCYQKAGDPLRALGCLVGSFVLLLGSLVFILCLKRRDVEPSREAGLLFFWTFLAGLPAATYGVWQWDTKILSVLAHRPHSGGTEVVLLYASIIISLVYAMLALVWLKTNISACDHAEPRAWSARTVRRLDAIFVAPYNK